MTTAKPGGDFELAYNASVQNAELKPVSRASANALIERLLKVHESSQSSSLTQQIQEAAAKGNTDLIFSLTDELRRTKDNEQKRADKLLEVASGFTLAEVLRAYPEQYRELVHEVALLVLETTEKGIKAGKRQSSGEGSPRPFRDTGPTYIISQNGQHFEAKKNVGAAKSPGAEKAFYEFMGLDVSADGKTVDPATFVNIKGDTVPTNSKKNIINDLLAGHKLWLDKGFRIREKPSTAGQ